MGVTTTKYLLPHLMVGRRRRRMPIPIADCDYMLSPATALEIVAKVSEHEPSVDVASTTLK